MSGARPRPNASGKAMPATEMPSGRRRVMPQVAEIKLESNQEEKQDQTELTQDTEDVAQRQVGEFVRYVVQVRSKDKTPNGRRQWLEHTWTKEQTRDNFADDGRLPDAPRQHRKQSSREQDHRKLNE